MLALIAAVAVSVVFPKCPSTWTIRGWQCSSNDIQTLLTGTCIYTSPKLNIEYIGKGENQKY